MQGIDVCDTIVLLQVVHAAAEKGFAIGPAECHKCKGCSWSMPQAAGRLLYIFNGNGQLSQAHANCHVQLGTLMICYCRQARVCQDELPMHICTLWPPTVSEPKGIAQPLSQIVDAAHSSFNGITSGQLSFEDFVRIGAWPGTPHVTRFETVIDERTLINYQRLKFHSP